MNKLYVDYYERPRELQIHKYKYLRAVMFEENSPLEHRHCDVQHEFYKHLDNATRNYIDQVDFEILGNSQWPTYFAWRIVHTLCKDLPEIVPTKHFVVLNNAAKKHRLNIMMDLNRRGLLDNNYWSWRMAKAHDTSDFPAPFDKPKYLDTVKSEELSGDPNITVKIPVPEYTSTAINVVLETWDWADMITEKTFLPIAYKKIPLIFGGYGIVKKLYDMGFEPYLGINTDYDLCECAHTRAQLFVDEIQRVTVAHSPQDIYHINRDVIDHNRKHLFHIVDQMLGVPKNLLLDIHKFGVGRLKHHPVILGAINRIIYSK